MSSIIHASLSKKYTILAFSCSPLFSAAALTMIEIELVEAFLQKDVLHLALFAMFF